MKYFCCDEPRRNKIEVQGNTLNLNGIDYIEVDDPQPGSSDPNFYLDIYMINDVSADLLTALQDEHNVLDPGRFVIEGGERIRNINAIQVTHPNTKLFHLQVSRPGDYSLYTLRLSPATTAEPLLDPLLSAIDFSFKVNCPSDFDCKEQTICPSETIKTPAINYLAKDYASFKKLLFDRLALLIPGWRENNPADLGVTLVELLAYAGDQLSYQQDAVATEAYLHTARRRVSVRRHARLVDYPMHDGCNARAWVQLRVKKNNGPVTIEQGTQLLTRVNDLPVTIRKKGSLTYRNAMSASPAVFETLYPVTLHEVLNEMPFYTWGATQCCIPKGATRATLSGHYTRLKAGDVVVFTEQYGAKSGEREDARMEQRCAVRLTHVKPANDPLGGQFLDPPTEDGLNITEIQWHKDDALPFPVCVSKIVIDEEGQTKEVATSVVLGNIVLADHGMTIEEEVLPIVPDEDNSTLIRTQDINKDWCKSPGQRQDRRQQKYYPTLTHGPLTFAHPLHEKVLFRTKYSNALGASLDTGNLPSVIQAGLINVGIVFDQPIIKGRTAAWSVSDGKIACAIHKTSVPLESDEPAYLVVTQIKESVETLMNVSPQSAMAAIDLHSFDIYFDDGEAKRKLLEPWTVRRDLLASDDLAREFVVETNSDGSAQLRFGDDRYGMRPEQKTQFVATYRIGNGASGNIGAQTLHHIVADTSAIDSVFNPMPAQGGTDLESLEQVRQRAPYAFRTQARAVTPEDYAYYATQHPQVQRARAARRWTGSWYTIVITVDRQGGYDVDEAFEQALREYLQPYRMAGHDIEIESPRYVPLEIELEICIKPDYFRSDVVDALRQVFSSHYLPNGRRGFFHPDNYVFGQTVYLSKIYAAAQGVEGVESVLATKFQRQDTPGDSALGNKKIELDRLEIARLENDPNFPERGTLELVPRGGK